MATTNLTRYLRSLTLQSHLQFKALGERLARHPTTHLSLTSSIFQGGSYDENIQLIPRLVNFDVFDRDLSPKMWSLKKKIITTILVTEISWLVQFASAIDACAPEAMETRFGVGPYVSALATSLFLIGFALGAPIAGPMSEATGRNPVYILSLFCFLISLLIAAVSSSLPFFLMARFSAGFFGSAPLVCAGGSISDLWCARDQLVVFPLYAAGGMSGLASGAAAGGILAYVGSINFAQATEWSTLIIGTIVFVFILLFQPETYSPILLKWKTGMIVDGMKTEERDMAFPPSKYTCLADDMKLLSRTLWVAFSEPFIMAFNEPLVMILSMVLSIMYLIVFTLLPGYVSIFSGVYHFGYAARGLTFYGLAVGMLVGLGFAMLLAKYWRKHYPGDTLPTFEAEAPLDFAVLGIPAVAISLFWMGFTAREGISYWSPLCASVLLGFGILCTFLSSYMYIIRAYGLQAASGLVFITLVRYLLAGGMVVAGVGLFEHIGIAYTFAIMGVLASLLIPVPFLLYRHGSRLRLRSHRSARVL